MKVRAKTRAPIRMKSTKAESFSVEFRRLTDDRHRHTALHGREDQRAGAPMAPPSVGVARPMKIEPSTRKTSASGGTSTMDDALSREVGQSLSRAAG